MSTLTNMKILHKANLLLLTLFTSSFAYADFDWKGLFTGKGFGLSLADMFGNLIAFNIFGYSFIKWMAILTGTFLIILAAHKYVRSGDGKEEVRASFYALVAGICLVSMSSFIEIVSTTLAIDNNSMGTTLISSCAMDFAQDRNCGMDDSVEAQMLRGIHGVITFLKFLGACGVFRGFYGIYEMGNNKQGGGFWKSIMFIFGGTMCINIIGFAILFTNTIAKGNTGFTSYLIKLL